MLYDPYFPEHPLRKPFANFSSIVYESRSVFSDVPSRDVHGIDQVRGMAHIDAAGAVGDVVDVHRPVYLVGFGYVLREMDIVRVSHVEDVGYVVGVGRVRDVLAVEYVLGVLRIRTVHDDHHIRNVGGV